METINPTGGTPYPFDAVRTAIVMSYRVNDMIADQVLPPTPQLLSPKFAYTKWEKDDAFKLPDARLGRKGKPGAVEFSGSQINDECEHYGLSDFVPQEDIDKAEVNLQQGGVITDPVDHASLGITHSLKLLREKRVADAVFNTANYDADYRAAVAGGSRFDDAASDPWGLLETAKTAMLNPPNIVVFGQEAWSKFRQHPKVLKAVHGNDGDSGLARRKDVADVLEVSQILVGRSRIDNAAPGQDANLIRAWGKFVALLYIDGVGGSMPGQSEMAVGANMERPSFGFTAVYKPLGVYTSMQGSRGIAGATEVVVRESCKEIISGGDGFGYLLSTVVD